MPDIVPVLSRQGKPPKRFDNSRASGQHWAAFVHDCERSALGATVDRLPGPAVPLRGGVYADRILRGTKLGDIPVERPTQLELVVNLNTSRNQGIVPAVYPGAPRRVNERAGITDPTHRKIDCLH